MKTDWDCGKVLRTGRRLFYGGLGVLLLEYLLLQTLSLDKISLTAAIAVAVAGVVCIAAGLLLVALRLVCPRCGASLMLGGRMPSHLPEYCPHCGEKIER